MHLIARFLTLAGMLALGFMGLPSLVSAASVDPPLILEDRDLGSEYIDRPLIVGLNPADTEVLIYVNGEYQGQAWVNASGGQTDNFYYQPVSLWLPGQYEVRAIARNKTSLLQSVFSEAHFIEIKGLPAPTMVAPNESTVTAKVKPVITGLTRSHTMVHVYIDGVYNGRTEFVQHGSGTADFSYRPFLNLSVGRHYLWTVAEDTHGRKSARSPIVYFNIEEPYPAPVIRHVDISRAYESGRPQIQGVAQKGSLIKVFIDHVLDGQFYLPESENNALGFSYYPYQKLKPGKYLLYSTATDARGKESQWSGINYFTIPAPLPANSDLIVREPVDVLSTESPETNDVPDVLTDDPSDLEIDADVADILERTISTDTDPTGAINEDRESQGKLRLNLLIFILFLLGVIGWIFWVNRELIKERQKKNTAHDD